MNETHSSKSDKSLAPSSSNRIASAIERFVTKLEGIQHALKIVMPLVAKESERAKKTFEAFLAEGEVERVEKEKKTTYTIPLSKTGTFELLHRKRSSLHAAYIETPRALFVAMVSCYDAFLGDLLEGVFYLKPEMLNASKRELTFEELMKLGSIENAREYLVEKEVESVLRESHTKQFEWMETRFGMPLRKDLDAWKVFLELTERRNLFVHTDGEISRQYLDVCKTHNIDITDRKIGQRFGVSPKYFLQSFVCLYEIGVKLAHVLWRKFAPDELEAADDALVCTVFDLLKDENYRLAACLCEFATKTLKKHYSNATKRVFIINLAIAYKWGGAPDKAKATTGNEDWSDCSEKFKLAVAVLSDDFDEAEKLMRGLGEEAAGISRVGYETWPLFQDFRKTLQFKNAFKDIYGEEFVIELESTATDVPKDELQLKTNQE